MFISEKICIVNVLLDMRAEKFGEIFFHRPPLY